jgi:hypothetical protein
MKGELEKGISKNGFLNLSYEKNIKAKADYFGLGLRFNFGFAQTALSVLQSNHTTYTTESGRGSLLFDDRTKQLKVNNQNNVGRGSLVVATFLDINCNGKHDANEPKIAGLKLRVNGGIMERNEADTTIRISGLEAYTNYLIELDKNSFDNVAWQLKKSTISVTIEPNHHNYIEVPVAVVGEASGNVYLQNKGEQKALERIIVAIYDNNAKMITRMLTESDGYFSYLGLAPGSYTARLDSAQLRKLNLKSVPETVPFTIASNADGSISNDITFKLQSLTNEAETDTKKVEAILIKSEEPKKSSNAKEQKKVARQGTSVLKGNKYNVKTKH